MANVLDHFLTLKEDDEEMCAYCTHEPVDPKYAPYCSSRCAINADNDNALDEQELSGDVSGAPEYKLGKSSMTESRFRDAHPSIRCNATVALSDKSTAQCGRKKIDIVHGFCLQHATMANRGKTVTPWDDVNASEYKLDKSSMTESKMFGFEFKGQYRCTNSQCDYRNERTEAGKCPGCGKPTTKIVSEGEPTQSSGSLYGGPTGSIGESDIGLVGFKTFTEDNFGDATGMKVDDPRRIALIQKAREDLKPKSIKEAGVAPVNEREAGKKVTKEAETHQARRSPELERSVGGDTNTELPARGRDVLPPLDEETKVVSGITYYKVFNAAGKPTWVTVPPREQDEDVDGVTAQSGLHEAIGNAPTRTGFFKKLIAEYPDIPVRYRNLNTKLCAESQDKATLHKIATFAHQNGLQTEMKKSPYDEWDSTWILVVQGFKK